MNRRSAVLALGVAAGAVAGAALFTSPVAYADDDQLLDISGLQGPIGEPTNVVNMNELLYTYRQEDDLYQVVNDGNVIGQFTDTPSSLIVAPLGYTVPVFLGFFDIKDVISDSTYAGLADGATQQDMALVVIGPEFYPFTILGNDIVNNTGIATSDVLTVFDVPIQLWDIPADTAAGADLTALF